MSLEKLAAELWKLSDYPPILQNLHELSVKFAEYKKLYGETDFGGDAAKALAGLCEKLDEPEDLWPKLLDRFFKKI